MQKMDKTHDYSNRVMERGDTVSTINGYLTARICDIATDGETAFVRLRPLHQPYGPGTWHAADRVLWIAAANRRKRNKKAAATNGHGNEGEAGKSTSEGPKIFKSSSKSGSAA